LRWVCGQPRKEAQWCLHSGLERSRDRSKVFLGHAIEVLREAVESLPSRVVAEEDAMLEMRRGELVAKDSLAPHARPDNIDHRAGFEVAQDALHLVFVVWGVDGQSIRGNACGTRIAQLLEELDLDSNC